MARRRDEGSAAVGPLTGRGRRAAATLNDDDDNDAHSAAANAA